MDRNGHRADGADCPAAAHSDALAGRCWAAETAFRRHLRRTDQDRPVRLRPILPADAAHVGHGSLAFRHAPGTRRAAECDQTEAAPATRSVFRPFGCRSQRPAKWMDEGE